MEHLELPEDLTPVLCKISLLAQEAPIYDDGDFEMFPERCGFDAIDLFLDKTNFEILSFVQSWLFFGTLRSVFGSMYSQQDFIHEERNPLRRWVTTKRIPTYIKDLPRWPRSWRFGDASAPGHIPDLVERCKVFDVACLNYERLMRDLDGNLSLATQKKWDLVLLSIAVLLEYFEPVMEVQNPLRKIEPHYPSVRPIVDALSETPG